MHHLLSYTQCVFAHGANSNIPASNLTMGCQTSVTCSASARQATGQQRCLDGRGRCWRHPVPLGRNLWAMCRKQQIVVLA
jgi:hypothetical protein